LLLLSLLSLLLRLLRLRLPQVRLICASVELRLRLRLRMRMRLAQIVPRARGLAITAELTLLMMLAAEIIIRLTLGFWLRVHLLPRLRGLRLARRDPPVRVVRVRRGRRNVVTGRFLPGRRRLRLGGRRLPARHVVVTPRRGDGGQQGGEGRGPPLCRRPEREGVERRLSQAVAPLRFVASEHGRHVGIGRSHLGLLMRVDDMDDGHVRTHTWMHTVEISSASTSPSGCTRRGFSAGEGLTCHRHRPARHQFHPPPTQRHSDPRERGGLTEAKNCRHPPETPGSSLSRRVL
jgi:hypothetical protein